MSKYIYLGNPLSGIEELDAFIAINDFAAKVNSMKIDNLGELDLERYRQLQFLTNYCKEALSSFNLDFLGGTASTVLDYKIQSIASAIRNTNNSLAQSTVEFAIQSGLQNIRNNVIPIVVALPSGIIGEQTNALKASMQTLEHFLQHSQSVIDKARQFENTANSLREKIDQYDVRIEGKLREISDYATQRLNQLEGNYTESQKAILTEAKSKIDTAKSDLDKEVEEVRKIAQVLAVNGIAGGYSQQALDQDKAYKRWRCGAIGLFSCSAVIAALVLIFINNKLELNEYGPKLLSSLVVLLPGFYAAREAEKHRKLAEHYQKMELEFVTLNPYLNDLEVETKQKIKQDLIGQYFTGAKTLGQGESLDSNELDILKKLIEAVREVPSKVLDKFLK
jgi:hypothetical protein